MIESKITMTEKDFGWSKVVKFAQAGSAGVTVGVHDDKARQTYKGGATVAEVAAHNEYGTKKDGNVHVPERSFLRSTMIENAFRYNQMILHAIGQIPKSLTTARQMLAVVGAAMKKDVVAKIDSGVPPPNAESTIKRKGHGLTLRETYMLRDSIDFKTQNLNALRDRIRFFLKGE